MIPIYVAKLTSCLSGADFYDCGFFRRKLKKAKMVEKTTDGLENVVHQQNKSSDNILIRETRDYKWREVEEEVQKREIKITLKQT